MQCVLLTSFNSLLKLSCVCAEGNIKSTVFGFHGTITVSSEVKFCQETDLVNCPKKVLEVVCNDLQSLTSDLKSTFWFKRVMKNGR